LHPQTPGITLDLMIFGWTLVHGVLGRDLRFCEIDWVWGHEILFIASPSCTCTPPKIWLQSLGWNERSIEWKLGLDPQVWFCSSWFWTRTVCESMTGDPWGSCVWGEVFEVPGCFEWTVRACATDNSYLTDGPRLIDKWSVHSGTFLSVLEFLTDGPWC
jgi:hypothetical protein